MNMELNADSFTLTSTDGVELVKVGILAEGPFMIAEGHTFAKGSMLREATSAPFVYSAKTTVQERERLKVMARRQRQALSKERYELKQAPKALAAHRRYEAFLRRDDLDFGAW